MSVVIPEIYFHGKFHLNGSKVAGTLLLKRKNSPQEGEGKGFLFQNFELSFGMSLDILEIQLIKKPHKKQPLRINLTCSVIEITVTSTTLQTTIKLLSLY